MRAKLKLALPLIFIVPSIVYAGPVTVTVTDPTLIAAGAGQYLTDKINSSFQIPAMGNFLTSMSNAQSLANKGQGVSYATEQSLFVVGINGGVGINNTGSSGFDFKGNGGLPGIGVGIQASGMVGISLSKLPLPSLGPIDLKRFTVFVNFFSYSNDSAIDSLTAKTNTFGLHLQYKLIDGKNLGGIGILNWGGVALTTGFDVSSNNLNYKIGQTISTPVSGSTVTWTPNAASSLSLDSSVFTIPIEISTSVRVLYVLSLFGGVGVDINSGKTSIGANMDGIISSTGTVTNANAGNAQLNINESSRPSVGQARFFIGPQLNLVPLKNTNVLSLYAQLNIATGGNYGAHAGVRIAW